MHDGSDVRYKEQLCDNFGRNKILGGGGLETDHMPGNTRAEEEVISQHSCTCPSVILLLLGQRLLGLLIHVYDVQHESLSRAYASLYTPDAHERHHGSR